MFSVEPNLKIDSCLCDRCFKSMEKTYKFNEIKKKKEISGTDIVDEVLIEDDVDKSSILITKAIYKEEYKIFKNRNGSVKRKREADICSVHGCSEYSIHRLSVDECIQIKNILSLFDICRVSELSNSSNN